MKKICTLLFIALAMCACTNRGGDNNNNNSNSNNNNNQNNNNNSSIGWVLVGNENISEGEAASPILKFYNHIPYVAFIDDPSGTSLVRVMKYVASTETWEDVGVGGGGFSTPTGSSALAFDISSTGVLYVAYSDGPMSKLTVRKFDSAWSNIGGTGISTGVVDHVAITLKGGTTPYVAYNEVGTGSVTLKKYSGGWSGAIGGSTSNADYVSLASDNSNVFLAMVTAPPLETIDLKKYNAIDTESAIAFPVAHRMSNLTLFLSGDYLYVTNIDIDNSYNVSLLRYNTTTPGWSSIGTSQYISDGAAGAPSIYVKSNGISDDVAYVAYRDQTVLDKASVKFCLDNPIVACANLGGLGFSSSSIMSIYMSFDDGHPYVAYTDATTGTIDVKKY